MNKPSWSPWKRRILWVLCMRQPYPPSVENGGPHCVFEDQSADFYLKEYELLRKDMDALSNEYQALEKNAVVAVGITLAWLFHERAYMPKWAWFIPFLFAILGTSRSKGLAQTFEIMNRYTKKIERSFSRFDSPGGWTHHSDREGLQPEGLISFWRVLFYATFALGLYGVWHRF